MDNEAKERTRSRWFTRPLDASSTLPIYFGIVVGLAGLILIAITWGDVAAQTSVARQLPYVISGGFTGLALVMVGMTIVNVQVRRRDVAERARQMQRLMDVLTHSGRDTPHSTALPRDSDSTRLGEAEE